MRHSVLIVGEEQPVPVEGRLIVRETVVKTNARDITFVKPQGGTGKFAVDCENAHRPARG